MENVKLGNGFTSVFKDMPKSQHELTGDGSFYFSPKLMVIEGKRKFKAVFQVEKKQFYRDGDNSIRDDFGHLQPHCWIYLPIFKK